MSGTGSDKITYRSYDKKTSKFSTEEVKYIRKQIQSKILRDRIKIETKRPKHPKQDYILFHLERRLTILSSSKPINKIKNELNTRILPHPVYHREIIKGMRDMDMDLDMDIEMDIEMGKNKHQTRHPLFHHKNSIEKDISALINNLDKIIKDSQ